MKPLLLFLLLSACLFSCNKTGDNTFNVPEIDPDDYQTYLREAKSYIHHNNLNDDFFILIDLGKHSGINRLMVWNLTHDTIHSTHLVSHGCGDSPWGLDLSKEQPKFSNVEGSHCSSVGKYIIGERGWSNWGNHVKYLLHGMDTTNNNALCREIVFHSWDLVQDSVVYPAGTPEGWGCPAVSINSMKQIDDLLWQKERNTLMWIIGDDTFPHQAEVVSQN